ncbi:site-specific DNA-methyltransferase [Ostreiculturibacter nitratireducens]|uniref:DNA-methyltransferase n=1 Tax=Ostreiculturibacter nitratireducens TaxID=3075226 RepID=UPI0031B573B9
MGRAVNQRTKDLFSSSEEAVVPTQCKGHATKLPDFNVAEFVEGDGEPFFMSSHGALFDGDCTAFLRRVKSEAIDTVFADPPFNLDKKYGAKSNDKLPEAKYVAWCKEWLDECIRVLKPGGSLFVYNLPRWNIVLGAFLMEQGMMFRHDITVEIKSSLPITGRLYPAHYSLLYFTKGKPKTFRKIRTPIETCRHCGGEVKDYGGHRHAMNPLGVNLKDVWTDIPPVRHWKFKSKDRPANALSTKLLDRVVEISTQEGDVVVDPFGGSGTTFAVCEKKNRYWIGSELDFSQQIKERLLDKEIAHHANTDHVEG